MIFLLNTRLSRPTIWLFTLVALFCAQAYKPSFADTLNHTEPKKRAPMTATVNPAKATPPAPAFKLPDFSKYPNVKQKKQAFFDFLLPYVTQANAIILNQRAYAASLDFHQLTETDVNNIRSFIKRYRLKTQAINPQTQKTLLRKMDVIPPSLALAQAANETAWGSSRFARQGLNFYGQWCFTEGCGLVPLSRPKGEYHEVKKFKTPLESVRSYMLTLNSHPAFKALRDARYQARSHQKPINGLLMVHGLEPYSARKEIYVKAIASMIRTNHLLMLDKACSNPI